MSTLGIRGVRRLHGLGVALGLLTVFAVLRLAGANQAQISAATADPQAYVTAAGADEFVLVLATAIGWLLLGWVILGAVLVLGSAVPGWIGWLFNSLARLLLPATLRRFVSLALGVTLLGGTSVASAAPPVTMAVISVTLDWPGQQDPTLAAVPDWPTAPSGGPDSIPEPAAPPVSPEPAPASAGTYLVQAGDCLWDIAERTLAQAGRPIDAGSVATAVGAWFQLNSDQIQDPDLIYPGQALNPPILQP
ncbi:MAG: LysM peptidoglycan-binding domain-containing protein [Actinomycetota bacterium]|nr:LysM peptidoglycan-binding domain-containing protein [Actinomycetota bacterium]